MKNMFIYSPICIYIHELNPIIIVSADALPPVDAISGNINTYQTTYFEFVGFTAMLYPCIFSQHNNMPPC